MVWSTKLGDHTMASPRPSATLPNSSQKARTVPPCSRTRPFGSMTAPTLTLSSGSRSRRNTRDQGGCWMKAGVAAGREVRRQFWLLVRGGLVRTEAATTLGLNEDTGKEWFRQAGGVIPAFVSVPPSGRFLSFAEREEIFARGERGGASRAW